MNLCIECEYCFGCVGLKKKKYCILNKQYSKEEYEELKGKIISDMKRSGEYGKFLPYEMSADRLIFQRVFCIFRNQKEDIFETRGILGRD